jgi:ATP-binding cassette subfamily F protein 3
MREALTFALQDYEGGMVFVSHDRHLLRTCADELLLVADGKAVEFDGDLDDYAAWLASQRNAERSPEPEVAAEKTGRLQQRADAKANRQALLAQRRPLLKEIEQLERKLANRANRLPRPRRCPRPRNLDRIRRSAPAFPS